MQRIVVLGGGTLILLLAYLLCVFICISRTRLAYHFDFLKKTSILLILSRFPFKVC